MLQGFYSAASGMLMQQRNLNVISNNLANLQTAGYKTNRLLSSTYEQNFLARLERANSAYIGTGDPAQIVREVADIWTPGGVAETGRPFDLAITGVGLFNVQGEDGATYLTRDGQFDLDEEGYLILRDRGRVLGTNGAPILVQTSDITVSEDGVITNSVTGAAIGALAITVPAAGAVAEQQRNSMYTTTAADAVPAGQALIQQGAYERSSVDLTQELSAMIMAQRNFSTAAQALQWIDQTYAKAVNIAAL